MTSGDSESNTNSDSNSSTQGSDSDLESEQVSEQELARRWMVAFMWTMYHTNHHGKHPTSMLLLVDGHQRWAKQPLMEKLRHLLCRRPMFHERAVQLWILCSQLGCPVCGVLSPSNGLPSNAPDFFAWLLLRLLSFCEPAL